MLVACHVPINNLHKACTRFFPFLKCMWTTQARMGKLEWVSWAYMKFDISKCAFWVNRFGCMKGLPWMTSFLLCQINFIRMAASFSSRRSSFSYINCQILIKLECWKKIFCSSTQAWPAGQFHNTWLIVSSRLEQVGQVLSSITFLLVKFWSVGKISLHALQINTLTTLRVDSCRIIDCHMLELLDNWEEQQLVLNLKDWCRW